MRFCGQFETLIFFSRNLNRLAYTYYIYSSDGFLRVWLSFNFLKNGWRGINLEEKKNFSDECFGYIFYPFFLCSLSISINILNLIMKYTNI